MLLGPLGWPALPTTLVAATDRRGVGRRTVTPTELTARVWDLSVIAHEREAWLRHVFATDAPSLDAYLEDQLDGMI
jgi:hypothetical protein